MKNLLDYTINANGRLIDLSEPQVMGILNVTPDSFYAGSRKQSEKEIADRAEQIIREGGSMIDIGAFSTRPGAAQVTADEEMERMRRALQIVREVQPEALLSIDTFRPEVAKMAVEEFGAAIINDVSEGNINGAFGGADATNPNGEMEHEDSKYPAIFRMVAKLGVPYILMSTHGDMKDIMLNFAREVQLLRDLGAKDIILDPGFGFGKTLEQNYTLLDNMEQLKAFNLPILVGASRKSMIFKLLGSSPAEALNGTTVINTMSLLKGASILRVHDVKECVETVKIVKATVGE
ncbi:dihydropteroate synthase [Prevotella sp.]|uniref:dihydropteroate synthase n=1 Tax=Prevotella sp. TaxID=59823 RepID=UPI003AB94957